MKNIAIKWSNLLRSNESGYSKKQIKKMKRKKPKENDAEVLVCKRFSVVRVIVVLED